MKRTVLVGILLIALVCAATACNAVTAAEQAIDRIGTVTMHSAEAIETAEAQLAELSEDQRAHVENLPLLEEARTEYTRQAAEVEAVEAAILALSPVTPQSGSAIDEAEAMYNDLSAVQQEHVTGAFALTDAKAAYEAVCTAAAEFETAVTAIGTVTREKEPAITHARALYDALEPATQACLTESCEILLTAEETLYLIDVYEQISAVYESGDYAQTVQLCAPHVEKTYRSTYINKLHQLMMHALIPVIRQQFEAGQIEAAMALLEQYNMYHANEPYAQLRSDLTAMLAPLLPESGTLFRNELTDGSGILILTSENEDAFVKLENSTTGQSTTFFVRKGETAMLVGIPDGTYTLKYVTGPYWLSETALFGVKSEYWRTDGAYVFETVTEGHSFSYTRYTLSLYVHDSTGSAAPGESSVEISLEEF